MIVTAARDIKAGEEILVSYLLLEDYPKDNGYLAYQYGILLEGNEVRMKELPRDVCMGRMCVHRCVCVYGGSRVNFPQFWCVFCVCAVCAHVLLFVCSVLRLFKMYSCVCACL